MLQLLSLTFKNIRCFSDEQTVNFANREKLIQVDGRNENTGGSSGAGKTTVFLALDYLLGISDIPSTVLQSRLTKETIAVTGEFISDGIPLTISRSKKSGLTVKLGDDTISGNVKLAEEKLDEIIGIPKKIFKKMVHKKQKDGGFFLDMTAKEIYEFLVTMLGLNKFISQAEIITENVKKYMKELEAIRIEIGSLEDGLATLDEVVKNKVRPTTMIRQEDLEALEKSMSEWETTVSVVKEQKSNELNTVKYPGLSEGSFDETLLNSLQTQKNELKAKGQEVQGAAQTINNKLVEIMNLKEKVQNLAFESNKVKEESDRIEHEATCPTCKREWAGESAKARLEELRVSHSSLIMNILSHKKVIDTEPFLLEQVKRLENILEDLDGKNDHLNQELAEEKVKRDSYQKTLDAENQVAQSAYHNEMNTIKAKYEGRIADAQSKWDSCRNEYSSLSASYNQHKTSLKAYEEELSKVAVMLNEKKSRIKDLTAGEKIIAQKVLVADESKRLIKTFTLQTFQETLDLIGDTATDILAAIPNMNSSTIYFEGCKENKDGSLKDEVNAIINSDGNNAVPIKSLSGGERTAIDLAVDLAVIDIIEAKAGKGADFFVIDEPFDGLDAVCKENCLEILKQLDTNKKIIMVDHSSELKEMVSDVIMVVKNGESSTIVA